MLFTLHPLGTDVVVMDVIFVLSKVVVPLSTGIETMMPFAGTANENVSLLLHAVIVSVAMATAMSVRE
jgi:hypothetical protein